MSGMGFNKREYDLSYRAEKMAQLNVTMSKEEKQLIADAAARAGLSVRKYLIQLVQQDLERK